MAPLPPSTQTKQNPKETEHAKLSQNCMHGISVVLVNYSQELSVGNSFLSWGVEFCVTFPSQYWDFEPVFVQVLCMVSHFL